MASNAAIVKDVKQFEVALSALKAQADSIVVSDASTCLAAKTAQRDVRNYLKDVHSKLDPFVNLAKRTYDETRDERNRWITPGEEIDALLASKVKTYERQEREAAEAEQRRINEERRRQAEIEAEKQRKADYERIAAEKKAQDKEIADAVKAGEVKKREAERLRKEAAERELRAREQAETDAKAAAQNVQEVTVAPMIPKVAGVPSRINYKAEVLDAAKLINAFVDAVVKRDTERAVYLRQFIIVDGQALGQEARLVKDSKKLASVIPGVRFYED